MVALSIVSSARLHVTVSLAPECATLYSRFHLQLHPPDLYVLDHKDVEIVTETLAKMGKGAEPARLPHGFDLVVLKYALTFYSKVRESERQCNIERARWQSGPPSAL